MFFLLLLNGFLSFFFVLIVSLTYQSFSPFFFVLKHPFNSFLITINQGHSFELGGLGDVVGRVFGHDQGIDGGEDLLEEGAVVVTDVWLIGCHIVDGHIVDGGGSSGRVKAPDIVLRRRHIDDIENEDDIKIPCYAHRGSSVLLSIPLRQAHVGEDRKEKAFWSLRGVKLLVQ